MKRTKNIRVQISSWLLLTGLALSAGCEPQDVTPGLWLSGQEMTTRVEDWRFTDDIEEVFIETQPWYFIPHSTTIWCVQLQGKLYIGSYGAESKAWEDNVMRNPHARIRVDGKIYRVVVTRINEEILTREIDLVYNQKYDMVEVFGEEVPQWWFYRLEQDFAADPDHVM